MTGGGGRCVAASLAKERKHPRACVGFKRRTLDEFSL
jgi:hypothetical protein